MCKSVYFFQLMNGLLSEIYQNAPGCANAQQRLAEKAV